MLLNFKSIVGTKVLCALLICLSCNLANAQEVTNGAEIAKKNLCLGCHAENQKIVGPSFQSIAQRYSNTPETFTYLTNKIKLGGSGVWGVVPMPANKNNIKDEEIQLIIQWIFTKKQKNSIK